MFLKFEWKFLFVCKLKEKLLFTRYTKMQMAVPDVTETEPPLILHTVDENSEL